MDSLRGSSVKIGTIQRRLAWPLRKDDTHKSRSVNISLYTAVCPGSPARLPLRNMWVASQRSLHNAPIFRLLLKVAVKGTHQCDFTNFCGAYGPNNVNMHTSYSGRDATVWARTCNKAAISGLVLFATPAASTSYKAATAKPAPS